MKLSDKITRFICHQVGHKWAYAFQNWNALRKTEVRFCRRCGESQHWTEVPSFKGIQKIWMNHVRYTEKGAKEHVEGYGK